MGGNCTIKWDCSYGKRGIYAGMLLETSRVQLTVSFTPISALPGQFLLYQPLYQSLNPRIFFTLCHQLMQQKLWQSSAAFQPYSHPALPRPARILHVTPLLSLKLSTWASANFAINKSISEHSLTIHLGFGDQCNYSTFVNEWITQDRAVAPANIQSFQSNPFCDSKALNKN